MGHAKRVSFAAGSLHAHRLQRIPRAAQQLNPRVRSSRRWREGSFMRLLISPWYNASRGIASCQHTLNTKSKTATRNADLVEETSLFRNSAKRDDISLRLAANASADTLKPTGR